MARRVCFDFVWSRSLELGEHDERSAAVHGRRGALHVVTGDPEIPATSLILLFCRVADVIWHRHSVTVSACRWATFHSPPSRRYTWVARKV
jgi:hypothetical protein